MSDLYRVVLTEAVSATGRQRPRLCLRVTQAHPDALSLRVLKNDVSPRRTTFFARLLASSEHPALSRDGVIAKSQGVTFLEHVSHDLARLVDHDRATLKRLAQQADWPELDVDAQLELYGQMPELVVADEPDAAGNFVDEALVEVRLAIDLPPDLAVGRAWGSAAHA